MLAMVAIVFEAAARAVGCGVEEFHPRPQPRRHPHSEPVLACDALGYIHYALEIQGYKVNR